jgi:hypothetical protein
MQRARERKPGQPSSVAVASTSRQARESTSISTSHTGEEDQMGTSSGGQMKGTTERL